MSKSNFRTAEWKSAIQMWEQCELQELINEIETNKNWNLEHLYLKTQTDNSLNLIEMNTPNKENIIRNFKVMINYVFATDQKAASFKAREYSDTIKAFSEFDGEIYTLKDAENILIKYGKKNPTKTLKKIEEILNTGVLVAAEKAKQNKLVIAVTNLTKVYSIGNKKAINLYNVHDISTVEELKVLYKKDNTVIHGKQAIGLEYFDDLNIRIPRNEMDSYNDIITSAAIKIDPECKCSINGSYRRGCSTSGDIDVLISSKNIGARGKLIEYLKKQSIIVETLANGQKKFMGISKIPNYDTFRHIDIIESSPEEYSFGVLYFTGSGGFNAKMRGIALDKGYSLNEYRLSNKYTKKEVSIDEINLKLGKSIFEDEKDIFKFLDMEYVEPIDRINVTPAKIV